MEKGISKITIQTENPSMEMREPEDETSFGTWHAEIGELPEDLSLWTDDIKFNFASKLSESVLSAFESSMDAQAKTIIGLSFIMLENNVEQLEGQVPFVGTRTDSSYETFDISLKITDAQSKGIIGDGSEKEEVSIEASSGLDAPAERTGSLLKDRDGILSIWEFMEKSIPSRDPERIGTAVTFLLTALETMSDNNAADLDMNLDGLHSGKGDDIVETGRSALFVAKRTSTKAPVLGRKKGF